MRRLIAAGALAVGSLMACQTITEELPVRATAVGPVIPVVVVPIPIPVPATPAPESNPAPTPNPNPNPKPTPNPPPPDDDDGDVPNNNAPVTKLGVKVFFVECNGDMVPGSEHATSANVGCRIHFDSTAKDASNAPTRPRGTPNWSFNDMSLIKIGKTVDFTPTALAVKGGTLVAWAEVDGVRSIDLRINIR
jgi:outer membrane biosynthesis protein TonB